MNNYFDAIQDANTVVTAIDNTLRFPESLEILRAKYIGDIQDFANLIKEVNSSGELLTRVRSKEFDSKKRMSFLKMFRRCVSPVLDTEATKKITKISSESLIENYGHTFKPITKLKSQFNNLNDHYISALAALLGEYDSRGQSGYLLTELFFDWFEAEHGDSLTIDGPKGAGKDIELDTIFPDYEGSYPCDFVIKDKATKNVLAVGFARYDSTRGGAQSDDRTGGNANKVEKAKAFCDGKNINFGIIFLSDGPGLTHGDTWAETCSIDGSWKGNVRVSTLKTAKERVTKDWLFSLK